MSPEGQTEIPGGHTRGSYRIDRLGRCYFHFSATSQLWFRRVCFATMIASLSIDSDIVDNDAIDYFEQYIC